MHQVKSFIGVAVAIFSVNSLVLAITDVYVETKFGTVRGYSIDLFGKSINSFYAIPYAQPPIGPLRFKPPQPGSVWQDVLDGTKESKSCIQMPLTGIFYGGPSSEDCLYLNVHAPKPTESTTGTLPVMVWIHGGGYAFGSGAMYNGTILATKDVIVVTFNYRLGALGFMSTEDDVMPGNYGMLDQVAALEWVKANIAAFGGDPQKVTIFGESAGAGSVSFHLLSPLTAGLFRGAIMESGSSLNPWGYAHPAQAISHSRVSKDISASVGCDFENSVDLLDCLQTVEANEIVNAANTISNSLSGGNLLMIPRVETTFGFLPDLPQRLLQRGAFHHVNTIRGFNQHEYARFINVKRLQRNASPDTFKQLARSQLDLFTLADKDEIVSDLEDYYLLNITSGDHIAYAMASEEMTSDFAMVGGIVTEIIMASESSSGEKHYLYEFSVRPEGSTLPSWVTAVHGDELTYVFGSVVVSPSSDPRHRALSEDMMTLWTDFAKAGDPNEVSQSVDTLWKPFDVDNQNKLTLGLDDILLEKCMECNKTKIYFALLQQFNTAPDLSE